MADYSRLLQERHRCVSAEGILQDRCHQHEFIPCPRVVGSSPDLGAGFKS